MSGSLRLWIGCPAGLWAVLLGRSRLAACRRRGGGAGGSPTANGRAAPKQLQRAGARPPRRRGRWGEAKLVEARRRPGRAGPQAVAAGPWRWRPVLRVPGCSSSCWRRRPRWSRRRRVSGGAAELAVAAGRAGRARPLARSFSFSNMARGRGRRWRRPGGGRTLSAWLPPREPRAGGRGGARAWVLARADVPGSPRPPELQTLREVASGGAVQGWGLPSGKRVGAGRGPQGARLSWTWRAGAAPESLLVAVWRCPGHRTQSC